MTTTGQQHRQRYLDAMGIQAWRRRAPTPPAPDEAVSGDATLPGAPGPTPGGPAAGTGGERMPAEARQVPADWEALAAMVAGCTACELHRDRTQAVFGVGDRQARLMVIGEAPGADEDRQGEPFVGRAGRLLDEMLFAAGFRRHEVFIANVLKCRPPGNRDPQPGEMAACTPYLARQIELVAPDAILAVGRIAAQHLLGTDATIGRLRRGRHHYGPDRIPLVVTYHPAYLLRRPLEKAKSWQDLLRLRGALEGT